MNEQSLFIAALEKESPAERAAFLDQACAGDPDLRQRLERLLARHAQPDSLLDTPAVTGAYAPETDRPAAEAPALPASEGPGTVLGPYKLLQALGEGGMGAVFLAAQNRPVQRQVALKIIKPGMDSRQVVARFEAERQALALMDHPNIARVFDGGATATGRPYFVMELVKGVPITKFCDERRLTPRQRLELFIPVCQAVQHAHQKGIIHRDLKPSNVLVALYDGQPVPKVIDFGIAKATGPQLTEQTLITGFGAVVGTLEYMSPEQAELNQLDIDTRSDIYSLGVLLYELLTGTTPLEKKRLKEAVLLEVLRLVREEEPPRPSTRLSTTDELPAVAAKRGLEPKKLSGLVRGDLDWIVMKCLDKDRNRRYETANALASDVQRYLADEPVQACPPSLGYRVRKFARRHQAGLWTTAALLLLGVLAASGMGWALWDRAAQQAEEATRRTETERTVREALTRAKQLGEQAQQMPHATSVWAEAALTVWQQAEDTHAQAAAALNTGTAGAELRQQVAALREHLQQGRRQSEQAWTRALRKEKLLHNLDKARLGGSVWVDHQFDHAAAAARYAAAFADYNLAVIPGRTAELTQRLRAEAADVRDALIEALDDWAAAAAAVRTPWSAKDLWAAAEALDRDAWRQRYRAATMAADNRALLELSAAAPRASLPPSSLVVLARSLLGRKLRDEGLTLLRWGREHYLTDFWVHFELGCQLCADTGTTPLEVEEGIGAYRAALAIRPSVSAVHYNLGNALHRRQQLDEAITAFRKAIDLDPRLALGHYNLGNVLRDKHQWGEAIAAYCRAIEIAPDRSNCTALGSALLAQKQLDAAIAAYKRAIAIDPYFAPAYSNLGNALRDQGNLDEAIAVCRQAIALDAQFAPAHVNLGNALRAKGQENEALAAYRRAIALDPQHMLAHYNLGLLLYDQKQNDAAIAAYRQALKFDPKYAAAHNGLGQALYAGKQVEEAIAAYQQALTFDPQLAAAHNNLGLTFKDKKQWDQAISAFRKAVASDPHYAEAYNNLGMAYKVTEQWDAAIAAYRQAIILDSKLGPPHAALGQLLLKKGRFAEAKKYTQRALDLLPASHPMQPILERQRDQCTQLLALEAKLPAVLAHQAQPADSRERLGLIAVCEMQQRYTAAAQLYGEAFAADARLADDLAAAHRYNAACAAALAAAGAGPDDLERSRLRQQALAWLRADLALWRPRLADAAAGERLKIRTTLQHWLRDDDLAGIRDPAALHKLATEEQETARQLWAEVAELLKK
jgi:tetratricopeptide (TPR) repeat protein/serine/threonine protein kinase